MSGKMKSISYSFALSVYNRVEQAIPKPYRVWLLQRLSSLGINVLKIRSRLAYRATSDSQFTELYEDLGLGSSSLGVIDSNNSFNDFYSAVGPETVNLE